MEWLKLAAEHGPFGLISLALGVAVIHLYRKTEGLRDKYEALQAKRAEEKVQMHRDILSAMGERQQRRSERPRDEDSLRPKPRGSYSITNPTNRTRG